MYIEEILGFLIKNHMPVDVRLVCADQSERLAIKWVYNGLVTKQLDTDQRWEYIGEPPSNTVADWRLFTVDASSSSFAILYADAAPDDGNGADGDYYINTVSKEWFKKVSGSWVLVYDSSGPAGAAGADGKTLFNEADDPTAGEGVDGDSWLNTVSWHLFKKESGAWVDKGSIQGATGGDGADGADGLSLLTGIVDPTNEGSDGDKYLNTDTGDLFIKAGGVWSFESSIIGPSGPQGDDGAPGDRYTTTSTTELTIGAGNKNLTVETGLAYSVGQSIIIANDADNKMDGEVISYDSGTGALVAAVDTVEGSGTFSSWAVSLNGAPGPAGEDGTDGLSLLTGSTNPAPSLGKNGDSYVNTATNNFYVKQGGTWTFKFTLRGPKGDTGDAGEDGSMILVADGAPGGASGNDGDLYVNNANGNYYHKIAGSWQLQGNLQGPKGDDGDQGNAFQVDVGYNDVVLTDAMITQVEGFAASNIDPHVITVLDDTRSAAGQRTNITGSMKGKAIAWNGTSWFNYGTWRGPKGEQGVKGDDGESGAQGVRGTLIYMANTASLAQSYEDTARTFDKLILTANVTGWGVQGDVFQYNGIEFIHQFNIVGPKGDQGVKGDDGDKGEKGDDGAKGEQGSRGSAVTMVGSLTTWNAIQPNIIFGDIAILSNNITGVGSRGDVLVYDGADWFFSFNILGPKGDKGDDGDQGEQWVKGDPGRTVAVYYQANQPIGTLFDGDIWIVP